MAISYATGLANVKPENLVVFSVAAQYVLLLSPPFSD
jgi:hypothetical protein